MPPLSRINDWVFDLDNTLYPASADLFGQIDVRMGQYIGRLLDLAPEEARALQKRYFREHGTTLRGLMDSHGVEPRDFLDFVHDIDLSVLTPDQRVID
ncbi:MAG: pyrimidine 5'-nucleotidase, partial [Sphingomonadaceae bacterium]